jgi:UDP-N-acetylglucosamine:LPS N-acetylglucosamine transferase
MRILAVGGGSGGHVTPVVAVLRELKRRDSSAEIRFGVIVSSLHRRVVSWLILIRRYLSR